MKGFATVASTINQLRCGVGDIVRFEFPHHPLPAQRNITGRVRNVIERGASQPLVTYRLLEGKPLDFFDAKHDQYADMGYIVEIVERYRGPRPPRGRRIRVVADIQKTRSTMTGHPYELVADVLNGKYLDIPRPLSWASVMGLFLRDQPAVTSQINLSYYTVNRRAFERWVMRNYQRFTMTKTEWRQAEMADNDAWHDEGYYDHEPEI